MVNIPSSYDQSHAPHHPKQPPTHHQPHPFEPHRKNIVTTNSCPGCPKTTTGHAPACPRCLKRLPHTLQHALNEHDHHRALLAQQATTWLTQHPHLSDRELQVLELVAAGQRDSDIAHTLHLSVNTIRDHIKRISRRLGCTGRAHLMATAYQKGYLPTGDACTD